MAHRSGGRLLARGRARRVLVEPEFNYQHEFIRQR
jgi:hypothetical protein